MFKILYVKNITTSIDINVTILSTLYLDTFYYLQSTSFQIPVSCHIPTGARNGLDEEQGVREECLPIGQVSLSIAGLCLPGSPTDPECRLHEHRKLCRAILAGQFLAEEQ